MKWRFTVHLKDQDMVAMTKVDFNKLSYDEGLALVKEAKEAALIKQADTGFADKGKELWATISQFLQDNPGLLRNLGIGAGVGGGLGIASGLMGDKKSRRPIRRGIIGALLGALGGGAVHGGMKLLDVNTTNNAIATLQQIVDDAREKLDPETFKTEFLPRVQKEVGNNEKFKEILANATAKATPKTTPSTNVIAAPEREPLVSVPQYMRGAAGILGGQSLGARFAERARIENAASLAKDSPLATKVDPGPKGVKALQSAAEIVRTEAVPTKARARLAHFLLPKPGLTMRRILRVPGLKVNWQKLPPKPVLSEFLRKHYRPDANKPNILSTIRQKLYFPKLNKTHWRMPVPVVSPKVHNAYGTVQRGLGTRPLHAKARAVGGTLGGVAMLSPELIRAGKNLWNLLIPEQQPYDLTPAIEAAKAVGTVLKDK